MRRFNLRLRFPGWWPAKPQEERKRFARTIRLVLICFGYVISSVPVRAASKAQEKPLYLVARQGLVDLYFRHSVVLMLPVSYGPLIVGIIINRPTRFNLFQLFPSNPRLKHITFPAYFGGPVDVHDESMIFRASQAPKEVFQISPGVYISFDARFIKKFLRSPENDQKMRLFLGRAQWLPLQLQVEIMRGAWYRIHADPNLIFSASPKNVWQNLLEQARPSVITEREVAPKVLRVASAFH